MIWPYLILAYLSLIVYGLSDNIRGPLFPELIQHFGVSNTLGAWFYAVSSIFSFVGAWLCLHTLKKLDRVQNLYSALFVLFIGLVGLGISQNYYHLLLASAIFGLGLGQTTVIFNILATVGSSLKYRKQVISGLHSMYALSSFLAPLVVAGIYRMGGQWSQCFFFAAGLCALLIVVGRWNYRKENPQLEKNIEGSPESKVDSLELPQQKRPPGIYILAIAFGFYVVAEILLSSRLALYLRLEKNFDLEKSSFYLTGFFLCLLTSRLIFSVRPPKLSVHLQLLTSLAISFVAILLGLYIHEGFFIFAGLTMGPFYALSVIYVSEAFPQFLNQAMALSMAVQSLMVVLMHVSSGWMTDQWGIAWAMLAGPLCLASAMGLLWGFPRWKKSWSNL